MPRTILSAKPGPQSGRGRHRSYGKDLPTPEQIRQDPNIPWIEVDAFAGGKVRRFEVKTLSPVRWRSTGAMDRRLVIVRPVGYRLRKSARKLHTQPAYLIFTDPPWPCRKCFRAASGAGTSK